MVAFAEFFSSSGGAAATPPRQRFRTYAELSPALGMLSSLAALTFFAFPPPNDPMAATAAFDAGLAATAALLADACLPAACWPVRTAAAGVAFLGLETINALCSDSAVLSSSSDACRSSTGAAAALGGGFVGLPASGAFFDGVIAATLPGCTFFRTLLLTFTLPAILAGAFPASYTACTYEALDETLDETLGAPPWRTT